MLIKQIRLEILQASYWEHFKIAKDMARYLEPSHPKRQVMENEVNSILKEINKLLTPAEK